jgi:hypothetical protein
MYSTEYLKIPISNYDTGVCLYLTTILIIILECAPSTYEKTSLL